MSSNMDNLTTPTDDDLVPVLRLIRTENPDLGRAKIIDRLRDEHQWRVSETRLKKLLEKHGLLRPGQEPRNSLITYPDDALAAQQKYKDESTRCFKIYSRGPYNFGVSPNADTAIRIDISHNRLANAGRPKTEKDRMFIAKAWPMKCLFDYYWAAAKIAGVSMEDVGRQLEAEYGVNPIPYLPPPPTPAEVEARKALFKREGLKLKREMLKIPEARRYIPVDASGEPIWDEDKDGEFCLIVVKIDKGEGLQEFGQV